MTDQDAVRAAVLDHVESWFDGDVLRMRRVLHPQYRALEKFTAQDMLEATAEGLGCDEDAEDRQISIEVSYLKGDTARVTCLSHRYLEVLQLVRTPDGWKILSGIWQSQASCTALPPHSIRPDSVEPRCNGAALPFPIGRTFCNARLRRAGSASRRRRR